MPPLQMSCRGKAFRRGARYGSRLKQAIYANLTNFWSACSAVGLDKFDVIEEAPISGTGLLRLAHRRDQGDCAGFPFRTS